MTPPVYTTARPNAVKAVKRYSVNDISPEKEQKQINSIRLSFELFVLRRLLEDLIEELQRLPEIKLRFRAYAMEARSRFNDMRKKLNRNMGKEQLERFETKVCGIVDSVDDYVDACRAELKGVLVQKIGYEQVEAAALIGMIGGVARIMQTIHRALSGKSDYNLQVITECVEYIDIHYGYRLLNENVLPDYEPTTAPFVRLFKKIEELIVVEKVENSFVWR